MTAGELLSLARGHFDSWDDAFALHTLQEIHNRLLRKIRVRPDETSDISLTSGTSEYAISSDILRVWDAAYYTSATDHFPLHPRSVDEMDIDTSGRWRRDDSSTPHHYDIRGGKLIVYPTPDTTTTGGYPIVRLYVAKKQTLTKATSMPDNVSDYEAWLYGVCRRYAAMKEPEKVGLFIELEKDALASLVAHDQGLTARYKPTMRPAAPRLRTV